MTAHTSAGTMAGNRTSSRTVLDGHPHTSKADPASHNPRFPPHRELAQVDGRYFETHALTAFHPVVPGRLPAALTVSATFPNSVWQALDPAETHWTTPARLTSHKQNHYWMHERQIGQAFDAVMLDLEDLLEVLIDETDSLDAVTGQNLQILKNQAATLKKRVAIEPDYAYTCMGLILLQVADLHQMVSSRFEADWIDDIQNNLKLSLEYPVSDTTSYSLQLNYQFFGQTQTGDEERGFMLSGIRLGRCHWWQRSSGNTPVVYLSRTEIATTFYRVSPPASQTVGFFCQLNVV